MNVLFIDTMHPLLIDKLRDLGFNCVEGYDFTREKIIEEIGNYDGVIIRSRVQLNKDILQHASNLKFIARAGAGMESIDVEYAKTKNIKLLNSPEGNRDAVGEHALGMLLSLMNYLNRADREIRDGKWNREMNRGHEIGERTVGIIGFGNMGSAFASKLRGLNCRIIAYDKYKKGFSSDYVKECSMEEILDQSDILSIHVPLTQETEYFVDDKLINNFRKNIYFVNTARGKCVRTDDLVKNIKSGKIIGACLDVIEYEDTSFEKFSVGKELSENPSWNYLMNSDRVILSPHIAGWSFESLERIAEVLFEKIKVFVEIQKEK